MGNTVNSGYRQIECDMPMADLCLYLRAYVSILLWRDREGHAYEENMLLSGMLIPRVNCTCPLETETCNNISRISDQGYSPVNIDLR